LKFGFDDETRASATTTAAGDVTTGVAVGVDVDAGAVVLGVGVDVDVGVVVPGVWVDVGVGAVVVDVGVAVGADVVDVGVGAVVVSVGTGIPFGSTVSTSCGAFAPLSRDAKSMPSVVSVARSNV
jgi:hypothetical protein